MGHKTDLFLRQKTTSTAELSERLLAGDRVALGRAITLVESNRAEHQAQAQAVLGHCLPHTGQSLRVGITGSPGVGKSSFIEALGQHLLQDPERRLAVLAIDPSSQVTRGSILGDKTRMEKLSADQRAFIRPSPAGRSLGGVAARTREALLLCEAAGFDTIFVETVGVGQSEVAVHGMVDFFLLLLLPGAGDELQGIKRGIVEMADLIAINKADGDREKLAQEARREYARALHLFPPKPSGWTPPVLTCSALQGQGLAEIWEQVEKFREQTTANGWFGQHRRQQSKKWFLETLDHRLRQKMFAPPERAALLASLEKQVAEGQITALAAAERMLAALLTAPPDNPSGT